MSCRLSRARAGPVGTAISAVPPTSPLAHASSPCGPATRLERGGGADDRGPACAIARGPRGWEVWTRKSTPGSSIPAGGLQEATGTNHRVMSVFSSSCSEAWTSRQTLLVSSLEIRLRRTRASFARALLTRKRCSFLTQARISALMSIEGRVIGGNMHRNN